MRHNPSLAAAAARARAARWQWLQVGLPPNPNAAYVGAEMNNDGRQGQQGVQISQTFIRGHKLQLNRAVAEREVAVREQQWAAQQQRVLTDVTRSFYQVLVLQRRTEVVEQLMAVSNRAVAAAQRLYDAQETRKTDLLQARVEAQQAGLDLIRTQARLAAEWRRLASVLGLPELPLRPLDGDSRFDRPKMSWDEAVQRVLAGHPNIGTALAAVERASWSVQRARAERIPDVTAQVAVQHDNGTGYDVASIQLGLPLPLWDRNQGGFGAARSELTAARRNVDIVELQLRRQLAAVYQEYDAAHQQVERYANDILPLAQETLDLDVKGYEQGEVGFLDLLTAQRTYYRVNLEYLDALAELWSSVQRIEGLLLDNSLEWVE